MTYRERGGSYEGHPEVPHAEGGCPRGSRGTGIIRPDVQGGEGSADPAGY